MKVKGIRKLAPLIIVIMLCIFAIIMVGHSNMVEAKKLNASDGMIVFYLPSGSGNTTNEFLFWCQMDGTDIIDNGDTWDVHSEQGNWNGVNKALVTFDYFKYKAIDPNYSGSIDDLNLQTISGLELPKSQHIGVLTAVNTALARPATVTRKYQGQLYDVQCLVSQSVVDMWLAGDLQIGDYVIVSYIDEIPDTAEINVAVVTDKVYESW